MRSASRYLAQVILFCFVMTSVIGYGWAEEKHLADLEKYKAEEKNPGAAGLVSFFFGMGLGHAVAGDWERGLRYFGTELLAIGVIATGASMKASGDTGDNNIGILGGFIAVTAGIGLFITRFNEIGDAYWTAEEYNRMLKNRYGLDIVLRNGSPALQIGQTF